MSKDNFLIMLDGLKAEAEEVFSIYEDKIRDANDEVEGLEEQVSELENRDMFYVDKHNLNIVTVSMLEDLFDNLDHIPHSELESLINKYKR